MTPKNIPISLNIITFFSSIASGKDKPTIPIIKAKAVPIGIPFATSTRTMGKISETKST